jgi:hypothetical protein
VNQTLEADLPLRVIFEQPTVAGVAEAVAQYQTINSEDETARLLAELALLSDEEAQRLLDADTLNGREEV